MKKLVLDYVSRKFEFERHNTSIRIEVLAGLSTFLSLSYIFVVNPAILNEGGINKSVALFATVVTSALATFIMGWWAKKPFALAPGLEMNSYMVYFVIAGLGFSWQQGLGAIFWSGIIFLILTVTNIREKILDAIPDSLKLGLSASVGVFLMIIALRLSGVLIYEGITMNNFGNVLSLEFLILLIGFSLLLLFRYFNITGSVLYSIIVASFIANLMGLNQNEIDKITISKEMFTGIGQLDISVIVEPKMLAAIIILFVVDFYGSVAKFIGLTLNTTILKKDNKLPKLKETLLVDGTATIVGAGLGTTSVTTFVESGVGIGVGGRTGLTAVVCAILMLLFIPLAPLINLIPVIATTGALFWVGIFLFSLSFKQWKRQKLDIVVVVIMLIVTMVTFSLDKAMLMGFGAYILGQLFTGNAKKINLFLILSTILILIATMLTMLTMLNG